MRLTVFSDYSLRVLIYLGTRREGLATTAEIAQAYDISSSHLVKVVAELGARGYVETVRGKGGGLRLRMAPREISLGQVFRAGEEGTALVECFDIESNNCCIEPACAGRAILRRAQEAFFKALDPYTLADLLKPQRRLSALLSLPEPKGRRRA